MKRKTTSQTKSIFNAQVQKITYLPSLFNGSNVVVLYLLWICNKNDKKIKRDELRIELAPHKCPDGLSYQNEIEFEANYSYSDTGRLVISKPYRIRKIG